MPADWKALHDGIPPHSLVHLIAHPVPGALAEDLRVLLSLRLQWPLAVI